jgi:hypothetical protein
MNYIRITHAKLARLKKRIKRFAQTTLFLHERHKRQIYSNFKHLGIIANPHIAAKQFTAPLHTLQPDSV